MPRLTPAPATVRPALSQTAEYALRAAVYLAARPGPAPARVGELAAALGIPRNYLSKTLYQLTKAGLVASTRGKRGGFRLLRPPREVSLLEVVAPFDPPTDRSPCILGNPRCSDRTACAAHARWKRVAERTTAFFRETTLHDLIRPRPRRGRTKARP